MDAERDAIALYDALRRTSLAIWYQRKRGLPLSGSTAIKPRQSVIDMTHFECLRWSFLLATPYYCSGGVLIAPSVDPVSSLSRD